MIEAMMYVALGFLAATFLALGLLPALNRRAERLAKRRLEALFPLSIDEVKAARDHQRAEFAVAQRRLEQTLEDARLRWAAEREQSGRRLVTIDTLKGQIGEVRTELTGKEEALAALNAAHAALQEAHAAEELRRAEAETARDAAATTVSQHETALARAADETAERTAEMGALNVRLSAADIRIEDLEGTLKALKAELAAERETAAAQRARIQAEASHNAALTDRIHSLEALRDEQARRIEVQDHAADEAARLLAEGSHHAARREAALAERDAALAVAQARLARRDLEAVGRPQTPSLTAADRADLLSRIDAVADAIIRAHDPESPALRTAKPKRRPSPALA